MTTEREKQLVAEIAYLDRSIAAAELNVTGTPAEKERRRQTIERMKAERDKKKGRTPAAKR